MLQNNEWQARKEALRAQAEALRKQQEELRAQAEQLSAQQSAEERKMAELERVMEAPPKRGEDPSSARERCRQAKAEYMAAKARVKAMERTTREMERVEESVQDVEDEIEGVEDEVDDIDGDDEEDAEFPDLDPIQRKIQKAMERIGKIDFSAMEADVRAGLERGLAPLAKLQSIGFDQVREQMGGRANTIMTRLSDEDLQTMDILVDAGLASSRSECAAMLLHEGIVARKDMIQRVRDTADQIRKLRESMKDELRSVAAASGPKKDPGSE